MAAWRMAFRSGADVHRECDQCPHERWPQCRDLGVAAITYDPIQDIDFSPYSSEKQFPPKVKAAWSQLAPSQKASLRRFLFEMQEEDIIYVKQKELIVGKGVIGPYKFAKEGRIRSAHGGGFWRQQRLVTWDLEFPTVQIRIGRDQRAAVEPLTDEDVTRVEATVREDSGSWQRILEDPTPRPALSEAVEKVLKQIELGKVKPLDPDKL